MKNRSLLLFALGAIALASIAVGSSSNSLSVDKTSSASHTGGIATASGIESAEQQLKNERTFFEPISASLFSNHSSTTSILGKRSLTIRNPASNVTGNVALQDDTSMYYAPSDFRRGFVQQYARFDVMGDGKNVKILNMESFGDVLAKAQCDDNGTIGLTFPEDMDFQQVSDEWQWVNEGDNRTVILITENEHCDRNGTDGTPRQPWSVDEALFQNDHNHVDLRAKPVGFQEAFGKAWRLKIGRDSTPSSAFGPVRRGAHLARIPLNQNFSGVGLNLPPSLLLSSLLGEDDPVGTLTCDPCYTKGQLDFEIDIGGLNGGTIHITAQDLEASLTMRLEVYQALASKKSEDHEIYGFVPPHTGIYIKNIIDIGQTIKLIVSADFSKPIEKQVALALGYRMTARLTGFNPKLESLPPGISQDLEIEGRIGPKLELSLDWTILGQGAKVGFQFGAATLSLNVSSDGREPACGGKQEPNAITLPAASDKKDSNKNTTGVNLDLDLEQEILATQSVGFLGMGVSAKQTLASTSYDLVSKCIPITGVTTLQPKTATSAVSSYTPHAGDLTEIPKMVVKGIASAFKDFGLNVATEAVEAFEAVTTEAGKIASKVESEAEAATSAVVSVAQVVETKAESVAAAVTSKAGDIGDQVKDTAEEIGHAVKCFGGLFC